MDPAGTAVSRWAADAAAWTLPTTYWRRRPKSPYGRPAGMFRRWNMPAEASDEEAVTFGECEGRRGRESATRVRPTV